MATSNVVDASQRFLMKRLEENARKQIEAVQQRSANTSRGVSFKMNVDRDLLGRVGTREFWGLK